MSNHLKKRYFFPFVVFGALSALFFKGLSLNPKALPSTLVSKPLPPFEKPSIVHDEIQINEKTYQGKYWLLNVWASWCHSCLEEHANLFSLTNIPIVGLNYQDSKQDALNFITQYGNPFDEIIQDEDGHIGIDLGVYGTPETFLIDPSGKVLQRYAGVMSNDIWQQKFKGLIHE